MLSFFKNLRISLKLLFGFSIVLVILVIVSAFNVLSSFEIQGKSSYVQQRHYTDTIMVIEMVGHAEQIFGEIHHASESANYGPLEAARAERQELMEILNVLGKNLAEDAERLVELRLVQETFERVFATGEKLVYYMVEQDLMSFVETRIAYLKLLEEFRSAAQNLKNSMADSLTLTLDEVNQLSVQSIRLSTTLAIIGFILAISMALVTSRQIVSPMHRVMHMAHELGEGRLYNKLQIQRQDEIGKVAGAMDEMAEKFSAMVRRLNQAAEVLSSIAVNIDKVSTQVYEGGQVQAQGIETTLSAVLEIDASVREVSQGIEHLTIASQDNTTSICELSSSIEQVAGNAETLAHSVEEVSSSISEMAATIEQINMGVNVLKESADNTASSVAEMDSSIQNVEQHARETSEITQRVRKDAESGKTSVEATIQGIQQIRIASHTASTSIKSLQEKTQNIGSIISVIDEVADQTNLLALNAAIIAAQAGDHGRGFAVVADEIRELAELTSSSTREISATIQAVQEETRRAVAAIEQADGSITDGEQLSQRSGDVLRKIVEGTQQAAERMDHISRSTREQAQGSQVIRREIERVTQMVNQFAGAIREQTKGANMIMTAAHQMKDLTLQVSGSAGEQSKTSRIIAANMESISEMIHRINEECGEQKKGSDKIIQATEDIGKSSEENLKSITLLNDSVVRLTSQIQVLRQEVAAFKLQA